MIVIPDCNYMYTYVVIEDQIGKVNICGFTSIRHTYVYRLGGYSYIAG